MLRWSLWPLRNVVSELKRVQRGQANRMSEHHPRELQPLTDSINALVESERENLDHQRNTMSDLAHSLKTPLAVLRTRLDNGASEAELREEEHTDTAGGGHSWTVEGNDGCIVRVTFPAPRLKATIAGEGKAIEKIRALAGAAFTRLFLQVPAYKPTDSFRPEAEALLGSSASRKLIRACETASSPTVSFETKEIV